MEKVTVSAAALREVLMALNGPSHYIRELQATRGPLIGDNNPINILCDEFNAAVRAHNEAQAAADVATKEPSTAPTDENNGSKLKP